MENDVSNKREQVLNESGTGKMIERRLQMWQKV